MNFDFNKLDHSLIMRAAFQEAELALQAGERPMGTVFTARVASVARRKTS